MCFPLQVVQPEQPLVEKFVDVEIYQRIVFSNWAVTVLPKEGFMTRWIVRSAATVLGLAGLLVLSVEQSSAHVVFGNSLFSDASVIDPITGVLGVGSQFSNQDRNARSNAGWVAGLDATTWGDTHNTRFMYFNLAEAQTINFTVTATANSNGASLLNPGYSIFSGAIPNVSHDGGYYTGKSTFASWSPFAAENAAILAAPDNGGVAQKWGEFRANADVTMRADSATNTPIVSTMVYTGLFGVNSNGNTISGQYQLGPGLYTLVVGGANSTELAALLSHAIATNGDYTTPSGALIGYNNARLARNFNVQFNVAPVPLPAAVWLFGSGLVGVIAFARRRRSV
jgi:hypothetical protein